MLPMQQHTSEMRSAQLETGPSHHLQSYWALNEVARELEDPYCFGGKGGRVEERNTGVCLGWVGIYPTGGVPGAATLALRHNSIPVNAIVPNILFGAAAPAASCLLDRLALYDPCCRSLLQSPTISRCRGYSIK